MTKRDGLPESQDWSTYGDGCDLHEQCLSCPLPACRYELPPGRARVLTRAAALERLIATGVTMAEAATIMNLSRRTISRLYRVLMAQRH